MIRVFRDHAGRLHVVRVSRTDVVQCAKFWGGVFALSIISMAMMCLAAGIIV